jgi:hypothetical protein
LSLNTPLQHPSSWISLRLISLLALGLLIHVSFGFLLGFSVDEAHYALYASKLDWSYFDHPPLVGWAQWPLVALKLPVGLIRLIPEGLWLLACLQAVQLARDPQLRVSLRGASVAAAQRGELQPFNPEILDAAGLWAVGLVLLAPVMHVLAVGLLPDTLLMVLALGVFQITLKLCHPTHVAQNKYWLCLGLLLGLAGLSKYTAIFTAAAALFCLLRHHGLRVLLRKGPWLALILALLLVTPVFYWNAQHNWISFSYQLNHGTGASWEIKRLLSFVAVQFAAFGPLLVGATLVSIGLSVRQHNAEALHWLMFFLIPFGVTTLLSGSGGLPHWTAPAWLAATPFAARLIATDWAQGRKQMIRLCVYFQALICVIAFVLLFLGGLPYIGYSDDLGKKNPFADLYGWEQAGKTALKLSVKLDTQDIAVGNWTLASRLAWYAQPLSVHVLDNRFDQFDLWFGPMLPASDAIFVNWSQMRFELPVGPKQFQTCESIGSLDVERGGRSISAFNFFHCRHWGKQP